MTQKLRTPLDTILGDSIRSFYTEAPIDLDVVPDLKFRHFRLRLLDGAFYKVKHKIRSEADLRECLVESTPLDVYYSIALWLNPQKIASRLDPDILRNVYIACDLSFDIDVSKKVETLDDARIQALKLSDFLTSKGYKIRYYAFSGSKGFHVVADDPWRDETVDMKPLSRELKAISLRKELVKEALETGLVFDEKVSVDTRRIIRLPATINSKTGLLCTRLTRDELDLDIETIVKSAEGKNTIAPRIPLLREMTAPSANKIPGSPGRLGVRPGPDDGIYFSTFYTSNIPGTTLKIPVIEFEGWMRRKDVFSASERAQREYGLGNVLVFGDGERYWAVSLKAVSRRRVEKILGSSGSVNVNQCRKYGCTYTRIGRSIGVDGELVSPEPTLLKVLEGDLRGQASRTHFEFFASMGIRLNSGEMVFCGESKNNLEIIHSIIE